MRSSEELIQSGLDLPTFVTSSARPKRPHSSSISAPDTTSPMVARRANVIQEWNKLQRTHSKSGKEKGEPAKVSPFLPTIGFSFLSHYGIYVASFLARLIAEMLCSVLHMTVRVCRS